MALQRPNTFSRVNSKVNGNAGTLSLLAFLFGAVMFAMNVGWINKPGAHISREEFDALKHDVRIIREGLIGAGIIAPAGEK